MNDLVQLGQYSITTEALGNLVELANALKVVKTKEDGSLYLQFKGDVILETEKNIATFVDGFNIQLATQIHLNPNMEGIELKEMIKSSFGESKRLLVKMAAAGLDVKLTEENITEVVGGIKSIQQFGKDNDPYYHDCDQK